MTMRLMRCTKCLTVIAAKLPTTAGELRCEPCDEVRMFEPVDLTPEPEKASIHHDAFHHWPCGCFSLRTSELDTHPNAYTNDYCAHQPRTAQPTTPEPSPLRRKVEAVLPEPEETEWDETRSPMRFRWKGQLWTVYSDLSVCCEGDAFSPAAYLLAALLRRGA